MILPKKSDQNGQVLLSLLISLALFSILAHALFTLVSSSYSLTSYIKARRVAKNLAQQTIENIRNKPYDEIGTLGGIPSGNLLQNEDLVVNGLKYNIKTSVVYVDDRFDGQVPNDILPTDYKRARVDVSWEGVSASRGNPVTLISDISPQGIESTTGGGTLLIIVFDINIQPVSQADVHIVATSTNPVVNLTLKTAVDGRVFLPGAPPCSNSCYQITVNKNGYGSDRTYSVSEVANPSKPNLNISVGGLTEISFSIDKTGTINIASYKDRANNFEPLPSVAFQIRGDKTIGTDNDDQPVYKFYQILSTNEAGTLALNSMENDRYTITTSPLDGWDISGVNPFIPLVLDPEENIDFKFALSSHSANSVLLSFMNAMGNPITASISAELSRLDSQVVATESGTLGNPDYSEIFFSNLEPRIYNLTATASGFQTFTGIVDVIDYKTEKIILLNN